MTNNPKHGGPRKGAGRPKKEPTVTISFRVPEKHASSIKKKVIAIIDKLKN
jgi:hypothetical protein